MTAALTTRLRDEKIKTVRPNNHLELPWRLFDAHHICDFWQTTPRRSVLFVFCLGLLYPARVLFGQASVGLPNGQHEEAESERTGSMTSGGPHAAVYDDQNRPITAGGFVKSGPIVFREIAKQAGLATWRHKMGTPEKPSIVETNGSGVCLFDYDDDGWLDIYLVNGSTYDGLTGKAIPPHAALFHNNHDGTFTNVAEQAGVINDRWGVGCAAADYDNDGWPDLFVSNFGKNRLYHNNHDGTFTDVGEKAGVTVGGWSTGATWGDYDGDGRLDLFVPGYVQYDIAHPPMSGGAEVGYQKCEMRGMPVQCGPRGLKGELDHLFHNNGDGTFTDVSEKAGVAGHSRYYGLASLFIDLNNDGRPDLLVANDSTPNYLYLNNGDGTFTDASVDSGYALNQDGREMANMSIAYGDYDHSGWVSFYNGTFSDDYKPLYRSDHDGTFTDVSYELKMANPTFPFLTWGTAFFDYDNDGWLDIFLANGHVYPNVDNAGWGTTWKQRPLLFHNEGGKFTLIPPVEGTSLASLFAARGMAYGDLFNDGKIDVVTNNIDDVPALHRNVTENRNHWISFKLIGGPRSPRDAVGAKVFVTANGFTQRADVVSGGSYASSNDQRPHFGLGSASKIDKVLIVWPSGLRETVIPPAVDRLFTLEEGKGLQYDHR